MNDDLTAKLGAIKEAHGDIYITEFDGQEIAFRRPTRFEYRTFKADRADDTKKTVADERLTQTCVVYPEALVLGALFDKYPALASVLAGEIHEAAGGAKLEVKKA